MTKKDFGDERNSLFSFEGVESADVAQLAEQLTCNQQVNGSSPFIGFYVGYFGSLAQLVRASGS